MNQRRPGSDQCQGIHGERRLRHRVRRSLGVRQHDSIRRTASTVAAAPADAEAIDVAGKFVMPGMTETHAHLSFADASPFAIGATPVEEATITAVRNAALMLASGFTSAVSFGSTYKIDVALRDAINAGRIAGPRLLAAGRDLGATASNVDSPGGLSQIEDGPWALAQGGARTAQSCASTS